MGCNASCLSWKSYQKLWYASRCLESESRHHDGLESDEGEGHILFTTRRTKSRHFTRRIRREARVERGIGRAALYFGHRRDRRIAEEQYSVAQVGGSSETGYSSVPTGGGRHVKLGPANTEGCGLLNRLAAHDLQASALDRKLHIDLSAEFESQHGILSRQPLKDSSVDNLPLVDGKG